ncbi:MAG: iron(III) transport system permease protein [Maricaulis maris]
MIDPAWRSLTGEVFPILLTGTGAALVFAYLSRFAAAAISPAETALARVTPSLDGAARILGATRRRRVWHIHWPLIAAGVTSAGLLVFVEVLKELPATMILRPFNYDTLAIIAHNFASDERLGEAALPSLLIPLVALLPMIFVARYLSRQDR